MIDLVSALVVGALLCFSAGLGMFISPRLPPAHRGHETVEMMTLATGMLVTFAALVLGLITASVKAGYDEAVRNRQHYALQLTELDQCLRNYGPGADTARAYLRSYTAAIIASVWPSEPPPTGMSYPDTSGTHQLVITGAVPAFAGLVNRVGLELSRFSPTDPVLMHIADSCRQIYRDVADARLLVLETENEEAGLSTPFYRILVFWLMVIFASFGLIAPRHNLSVISIILCAVSLSTAIFVIVDLSRPYDGLFSVSSATMRTALGSMLRP